MGRKKTAEDHKLKDEETVKVGDAVLIRPPDKKTPPYIGVIQNFVRQKNEDMVKIRWYYRPEETMNGRRNFHGQKELFLSDHYDVTSADTIEGKCNVYSFQEYQALSSVDDDEYFCRFEYKAASGAFHPDHVTVYCLCEMPYNPDDLMVNCDVCNDWFHPKCIKKSFKEVREMSSYVCEGCLAKKAGGDDVTSPPLNKRPPSASPPKSSTGKTKRGRKKA
eukprot:jgi/Mesen1/11012/ME000098S10402